MQGQGPRSGSLISWRVQRIKEDGRQASLYTLMAAANGIGRRLGAWEGGGAWSLDVVLSSLEC